MTQRHLDHMVQEANSADPDVQCTPQELCADYAIPMAEILAIPETAEFLSEDEYDVWAVPEEVLAVEPYRYGVHYLADKICILLSNGPGYGSGVSCYLLRL